MEDTLRGSVSKVVYYITRRLNPCCNGRYSQSQRLHSNEQRGEVLILVLMEDSLREFGNVLKIILLSVLILVLMEDTLRVHQDYINALATVGS